MGEEEYKLFLGAKNKIIEIFNTRLSAFNDILGTAALRLGELDRKSGDSYDEQHVDEIIFRLLNIFKEQISETYLRSMYNKGFENIQSE